MYVYVWQGYIVKNPGLSPIRELITAASAFPQIERTTMPHQATIIEL